MAPDIAIVGGGPAGLCLGGILERAGFSYIVYERDPEHVPPQGGCLDLHPGSGQLAMQQAGCYDEMRKYGRAGDATINVIWDHQGNEAFTFGEGDDHPELDRGQIRKALLTAVPGEKIVWDRAVVKTERDGEGKIVLVFKDGTRASGFKLVIGADGAHSKVRPLITDATPNYTGIMFWTGEIHASNPFYSTMEKTAKAGPLIIMGRKTMIWNQRQGDGHYRIEIGFLRPKDFAEKNNIDLHDTEAVKKLMLTDEFFGSHGDEIKAIIRNIDSGFRAWPLSYMPTESLNWKPSADVTLVGDSAHVTPPFVGEGVNIALLDCVELVRKLKEFGIGKEAIAAYEREMFPRAIDVITRSNKSGDLYYDWKAPKSLMKANQLDPDRGGLGQDGGY